MLHQDLFNGGFGPFMLPVIPPGATIAPNSTVTDPGKTPGKLTPSGWVGVNLKKTECTSLAEAQERDKWGASVGFACGREGLVGLDNDIGDATVNDKVVELLGVHGIDYVIRTVADPKHHKELYFFRVVEDVTGEGVEIASKDIRVSHNGQKTAIQIIGAGKQFVVQGTHVGTGSPYVCNPPLTSMDLLPVVDLPVFEAFLEDLQAKLPTWGVELLGGVSNLIAGRAVRYEGQQASSEKELREWLELVPNTLEEFPGRDEWVEMLYAIYGASDGQPWGRDVWLQWCENVNQQPGLPEAYWDRIDPKDVRSGMGFIRHKARSRAPGRAASLDFKYVPDIDPEAITAAAAAGSSLWPLMKKRFAYVTSIARFVDTYTGQDVSTEALDMEMQSQVGTLIAQLPAGTPQQRTFGKMLMSQPDRVVVQTMTYHPGRPRIMDAEHDTLAFNRWRPGLGPLRPSTVRADAQPWIDLLAHVTGSVTNAEIAIKWMAFSVQHPDRKPNWHMVFVTKPGLGKDMMLRPFLTAIGAKNVAMIGVDEISSQFNEYLESKIVVVNEVKQRNNGGGKSAHDTANDLKKYLTSPPDTVTVNRKGLRPYSIPNLTGWVFLSNEDNAIYVADGDRRYWVVDNRAASKLPAAEYERFERWFKANPLVVPTFLAEYPLTANDVSDILSEAPMTDAKKALIALNADPVARALGEIVEEARLGTGPFACMLATSSDLAEALAQRGLNCLGSRLGRYLRQIDAVRPVVEYPDNPTSAGPVTHKGRSLRLWLLGDKDAQGNDLTALTRKQLADLYDTKTYSAPSGLVLNFPAATAAPAL